MVKVLVRAGVLTGARRRRQQKLRVQGTLEGTILPRKEDWFRAEVPYPHPIVMPHPYRTCRFFITEAEVCWGQEGEHVELTAETFFPDLVHLVVAHEWQLIDGIGELSPDQRNLVECRQGLCGHAHAR